ncbi:uncharacterized protein LOC121600013 [Anopheles merus]|uniref:uncharacterized protein LOC121600013 n=1 Tax=Anopheles merus TaxID=30066 RepID=UPI001BE44544|nr:uncharacterized protein LOC121600013 [Anopheles merus]
MEQNTADCSEPSSKKRRKDDSDTLNQTECEIDHINRLPYEILCKIFQHLYLEDQLPCALVCKRWYAILRSEPFQERMSFNYSHCFGLPIASHHLQYMASAFHCVFDDCGSDPVPANQAKVLEMVRKATAANDVPGPSSRPTPASAAGLLTPEQLLFSGELPLKSLHIKASFDRMRRFLADRLKNMQNLQHLTLTVLAEVAGDELPEKAPRWVIEHGTLPSLTWQLFANTNGYELKLPALERYTVDVANDFDLHYLMECSEQLVELTVWFYFERAMEQTLTRPFPRLRKLLMKRFDKGPLSPEPNTRGDDLAADRFAQSAPLLKDLTIDSCTVAYRIFRAVCLHNAGTLTRLTLSDVIFPRALFVLILELKNLEFLRLEECILEEGSRLRHVDLPKLQQLELINSGTCFRLDAGFAHVRRLQYSMDSQLSRLCRHLTMLEELEIVLRTRAPVAEAIREHFRSLALLPGLRTLTINGMKTNTRPWDHCQPMPNVEQLILRRCYLLRGNFALLPKLFPGLKVLTLEGTMIAYRRLPDGVQPVAFLQRRLKGYLPRCSVTLRHCDAEPVSTVLKMEDEVRWRTQLFEQGHMKQIPYGQTEGKKEKKRRKKIWNESMCD